MKLYLASVSIAVCDAVAQDLRADEDHEVGLVALAAARLEQLADERDAAEVGHALLAARRAVADQAAEHHDAAVLDEHVGVHGALVGDEAVRVARGAGELRALELDLELHQRAAFVDLRRDLEDGADFLALHGVEGIHVAVVVAAGVGELAGDERHFLRRP